MNRWPWRHSTMGRMITFDGARDFRAPHDWVLVLAGGRGSRMAHLTVTDSGLPCPKQFCSLGRGSSLLHETLRRARAVAPPERTLVAVTESHRRWWKGLANYLPAENLLAQPEQRGTGIGILHPLLEILRRDPAASLAILPADHYFRDETAIATGLRAAMRLTRKHPRQILLLGFEPEDLDADLGYIVPVAAQDETLRRVRRFVEKPGPERVRGLIEQGALCNSFILAADARALLELFEHHCPETVARLREFVAAPLEPVARRDALMRLYRDIPTIDFSDDVLAPGVVNLRVLRLPPCGWCDLGTPTRLERVLRRHGEVIDAASVAPAGVRGHVDLAARFRADQLAPVSSASSLRS